MSRKLVSWRSSLSLPVKEINLKTRNAWVGLNPMTNVTIIKFNDVGIMKINDKYHYD